MQEEAQRNQYLEALKLGLFSDEQGQLSPLAKAKALRRLLGRCLPADFIEAELQTDNARNENADMEAGQEVSVGVLDDHPLHIAEHRLFALQDRFRGEKGAGSACLKALLDHISHHERALEVKKKGEEHE